MWGSNNPFSNSFQGHKLSKTIKQIRVLIHVWSLLPSIRVVISVNEALFEGRISHEGLSEAVSAKLQNVMCRVIGAPKLCMLQGCWL